MRREAFEKFLDAYGGMKNTLAANMDANVKNHVFFAEARKHDGTPGGGPASGRRAAGGLPLR